MRLAQGGQSLRLCAAGEGGHGGQRVTGAAVLTPGPGCGSLPRPPGPPGRSSPRGAAWLPQAPARCPSTGRRVGPVLLCPPDPAAPTADLLTASRHGAELPGPDSQPPLPHPCGRRLTAVRGLWACADLVQPPFHPGRASLAVEPSDPRVGAVVARCGGQEGSTPPAPGGTLSPRVLSSWSWGHLGPQCRGLTVFLALT